MSSGQRLLTSSLSSFQNPQSCYIINKSNKKQQAATLDSSNVTNCNKNEQSYHEKQQQQQQQAAASQQFDRQQAFNINSHMNNPSLDNSTINTQSDNRLSLKEADKIVSMFKVKHKPEDTMPAKSRLKSEFAEQPERNLVRCYNDNKKILCENLFTPLLNKTTVTIILPLKVVTTVPLVLITLLLFCIITTISCHSTQEPVDSFNNTRLVVPSIQFDYNTSSTAQSNHKNTTEAFAFSNTNYNQKIISDTPTLNKAATIRSTRSLGHSKQPELLAEGLTLDQQQRTTQQQQQQQQQRHHWPIQQLDRIKSEAKVSALVGQNVILNCAVQFKDGIERPFAVNWFKYPNKLPLYIWYAGYPAHVAQGYENRVSRIGQASLNLTKVRETDQGLYECKIFYLDRRPDEKGNGTWIYLDVQAPPHFTQTPPQVNYVQAADSLQLTCQAESTPTPILRWYKNKVPIDADNGIYRLTSSSSPPQVADFNEDVQETTSTTDSQTATGRHHQSPSSRLDLFIDNIQAGVSTGDYSCLASNSEGSVEAKSQVVLAVPALISTWPRNQTKLEGEKLELSCQARALPSNITYKWLFNDKPLSALKSFESRYTTNKRDGSLTIHSLQRDDQGEYKCQATNGLFARTGGQINNKNTAKQPVDKHTQAQQQQPIYAEASAFVAVEYPARVTYSPAIQYLPLNLAGLIRCHVQARPGVEFFTWTLNNQQFDPNTDPNVERLQNGSLLIKQVSKIYEGKYRCTPFNKHGSAGSSSAMEVRVEEAPYFELRPADFYKANLNGQVKMTCEGRGQPKPNVFWRRPITIESMGGGLKRSKGDGAISSNYHHNTKRVVAHNSLASQVIKKSSFTTTQANNLANLNDEEGNEDHHLYATEGASVAPPGVNHEQHTLERLTLDEQQSAAAVGSTGEGGSVNNNFFPPLNSANEETAAQSGGDEEQQSVIMNYAKLPSDRSEFRNSHLVISSLRKEDHGRYECVIENEVATLVASTMLYIEETTPHAPTNLQVETKVWSAKLSWQPGYDGGFEQSFVVWYRQSSEPPAAESATNDQWASGGAGLAAGSLPVPVSPVPLIAHQQHYSSTGGGGGNSNGINTQQQTSSGGSEPAPDLNWKSANVQPSDSSSFTVQNLSQDTSYEFYVRARNIIGDGPRSQVVWASTKRAIQSGSSLTPVGDNTLPQDSQQELGFGVAAQASTLATASRNNNQQQQPAANELERQTSFSSSEEESSISAMEETKALNSSVLGIIHLVDVSGGTQPPAVANDSSSLEPSQQSSASLQQPLASSNPAHNNQDFSTSTSNNKVYRIYLPTKQQQQQHSNLTSDNNTTDKRESIGIAQNSTLHSTQQPFSPTTTTLAQTHAQNQTHSASKAQPHIQVEPSLVPQNVSMMKVAQGWVINWWPPQRFAASSSLTTNPLDRLELPKVAAPSGGLNQNEPLSAQAISYTVEYRDKAREKTSSASSSSSDNNNNNWQSLGSPSNGERSILIKDLKPGSEYAFRIFVTPTQNSLLPFARANSAEFKYLIPDNRRKPGSTQALSAGFVSGALFFIACIVIAVCAVNMCNKRRKKRAEKAAYVMMACPVLESHHDIAALNSNSLLMKNSNSAQGRISGLSGAKAPAITRGLSGLLEQQTNQRHNNHNNNNNNSSQSSASALATRLGWLLSDFLQRNLNHLRQQRTTTTTKHRTTTKDQAQQTSAEACRRIKFTSNPPYPVDVQQLEQQQQPPIGPTMSIEQYLDSSETIPTLAHAQLHQKEPNPAAHDDDDDDDDDDDCNDGRNLNLDHQQQQQQQQQQKEQTTKLDDYWIRQPSNRKWGTLTLAGSKLAERRAREAELRRAGNRQAANFGGYCEVDSLAGEFNHQERANQWPLAQPTAVESCYDQVALDEAPAMMMMSSESSSHLVSGNSRTLPRSFNSSQASNGIGLIWSQRQRESGQQFNHWLQQQLLHNQAATGKTTPADLNGGASLAPPTLAPKVPPRISQAGKRPQQQQKQQPSDGATVNSGPKWIPAVSMQTSQRSLLEASAIANTTTAQFHQRSISQGNEALDRQNLVPTSSRAPVERAANNNNNNNNNNFGSNKMLQSNFSEKEKTDDIGSNIRQQQQHWPIRGPTAQVAVAAAAAAYNTSSSHLSKLCQQQQQQIGFPLCAQQEQMDPRGGKHSNPHPLVHEGNTNSGSSSLKPNNNNNNNISNANFWAAFEQRTAESSVSDRMMKRSSEFAGTNFSSHLDKSRTFCGGGGGLHSILLSQLQLQQQWNRNSPARATLPLPNSHQQLQANNEAFEAEAEAEAGAEPVASFSSHNSQIQFNQRQQQRTQLTADTERSRAANGAPCAFYPPIKPPSRAMLAPQAAHQLIFNVPTTQEEEEEEAAFVCLNSSRRRRRRNAARNNNHHLSPANEQEQHALAGGHLFVRPTDLPSSVAPSNEIIMKPLPPLPLPPKVRGLPQAGQRSEQKRLNAQKSPALAQVDSIGAREKIETYLRHYQPPSSRENQLNNHQDQCSTSSSTSPIQVDQVEELTFQPYHNLPELKYTIPLPFRRAQDGKLILDETTHLRRSKRKYNQDHANVKSQPFASSTLTFGASRSANKKSSSSTTTTSTSEPATVRLARNLGSSSSCPAPPAQFTSAGACGYEADDSAFSPAEAAWPNANNSRSLATLLANQQQQQQQQLSSSYSIVCGAEQLMLAPPPDDSLENNLNSIVQVRGDELPDGQLSVRDASAIVLNEFIDAPLQASEPFYLRTPSPSAVPPSNGASKHPTSDGMKVAPSIPSRTDNIVNEDDGQNRGKRPPHMDNKNLSVHSNQLDQVQLSSRQHSSSNSSTSSSSSSTSSSSSNSPRSSNDFSSSAATTTENGGPVSDTVDENYEFDMISSCSSSAVLAREQQKKLRRQQQQHQQQQRHP